MITFKKCWCQSGKSYDNCCKQIEQNYNPKLARALISKFGAYLTAQPWFADIVKTEIDKYYLDNGEVDLDVHVFGAVIENLIFESDVYGKTPLQLFIESPGVPEYELATYKDWLANNVLSAFEVVDTVKGRAILLKDLLHNDKIYYVLENTVSISIEKGSFICCRLVPFLGKHIILGGFSAGVAEQFIYTLVRNQDNNPIRGIQLTRVMYGINHLNKKSDKQKISPKKAKDLFLSYCQEKKINVKENELESIFTNEDKAEKFIEKALAILETNTDKQTFFELWQNARTFYTNDANTNFKQGPIEEMLVKQMMIELQQDILANANNSSKSQTPNKVYKISDIKIDQWLSKKQKELNYKTAKQAILEERKLLNNPRKDFSYKVTFSLTKESTGDM
ncbi:MAG: SEC-C domain-containing protein [bacterium]|nr:SEC-C domain-containing protein [bacterium]